MEKRLACGMRKYIRRQKMIIRRMQKEKPEKDRLIKALLSRFYDI